MKRRDFIKYGTILAGACGICLLRKCNLLHPETVDINSVQEIKACKIPFERMEILAGGDVFPCSATFLNSKKPAGNIKKQDIQEIWNGKVYTQLRNKILKGDYSLCNTGNCYIYDYCSPEKISQDYKNGPKEITIGYDDECNYRCITCRDNVIINTSEQLNLYDKFYLPKIIKAAENAEIVTLLCNGDPMFSRHSKHLMSELVKAYPNIKFRLTTNGFHLDEKTLNKIGIQNNIQVVSVSINATKRETYKKIMRTDGFDIVMKNVEMMSDWFKQGKIAFLNLNFVVHLMNYKEMPDFVKLAKNLNAKAIFTTYKPWVGAKLHKKYNEIAVFEPTNKHYKEFSEMMKNPVFKDAEHCKLESELYNLAYS